MREGGPESRMGTIATKAATTCNSTRQGQALQPVLEDMARDPGAPKPFYTILQTILQTILHPNHFTLLQESACGTPGSGKQTPLGLHPSDLVMAPWKVMRVSHFSTACPQPSSEELSGRPQQPVLGQKRAHCFPVETHRGTSSPSPPPETSQAPLLYTIMEGGAPRVCKKELSGAAPYRSGLKGSQLRLSD